MPFSSLLILSVFSCVRSSQKEWNTQFPHKMEAWYDWRATSMGRSSEQQKHYDETLLTRPPENYGASYQQEEGKKLWAQNCASCHGADGKGNSAMNFDPPSREFGSMSLRMGFLFGGDKMRLGIMNKIRTGRSKQQKNIGQMPAFGNQLSNEQIWSLVLHIEKL